MNIREVKTTGNPTNFLEIETSPDGKIKTHISDDSKEYLLWLEQEAGITHDLIIEYCG
jgi:hypothetical protein